MDVDACLRVVECMDAELRAVAMRVCGSSDAASGLLRAVNNGDYHSQAARFLEAAGAILQARQDLADSMGSSLELDMLHVATKIKRSNRLTIPNS